MDSRLTLKSVWGPCLWDILHYMSFHVRSNNVDEFKFILTNHVPNIITCKSCKDKFLFFIKRYPLIKKQINLQNWLIQAHNEVNVLLKKPLWTFDRAYQRYMSPDAKKRVHCSFIKLSQIFRIILATNKDDKIFESFNHFTQFAMYSIL
jgi:hypothetical protein